MKMIPLEIYLLKISIGVHVHQLGSSIIKLIASDFLLVIIRGLFESRRKAFMFRSCIFIEDDECAQYPYMKMHPPHPHPLLPTVNK